jgi:hypothetical protein
MVYGMELQNTGAAYEAPRVDRVGTIAELTGMGPGGLGGPGPNPNALGPTASPPSAP